MRDRHGRGLRGALALPNSLTKRPVPLRRKGPEQVFADAVLSAVNKINAHCPEALYRVTIGVQEVPPMTQLYTRSKVPLAAATAPTDDENGNVIMFRRPIEFRAATRKDIYALVRQTLVEQLAVMTGRDVAEIDPDY